MKVVPMPTLGLNAGDLYYLIALRNQSRVENKRIFAGLYRGYRVYADPKAKSNGFAMEVEDTFK